jgi:LmbE family N-acetylglucosaminyl deacetylase
MAMSITLSGILVFGAHLDDAEFHVGGLLSLYRELDSAVKIISVTNGAADPYHSAGDVLARRRLAEAQAASALLGSVFEVWDYPDSQLDPSLDLRTQVIHEIHTFDLKE